MDREKVVISGVNGFVGCHLARELHNQGFSVVGVGREQECNREIDESLKDYYRADLIQEWPQIEKTRAIIHLAGLAAVGPSFDNPQFYISSNSAMVTNLCEYYLKRDEKPRIIIVSSGTVYDPNQEMPIDEGGKLNFSSPYSVSKVLNENQAEYYRRRGLECVVVRPFNHIGPGQAPGFVLTDFYERLSQLPSDEHSIITGNLETRRDYTDVRDIVRAYGKLALASTLQHSVYNLCSGRSVAGSEIFNILKHEMGRDDVDYRIDQSLVRPTEIMNIAGDCSRLSAELGWQPQISLQQTISDFVKSKAS